MPIDESYRGGNTKHSWPNVVARLMGMDALPSRIEPAIHEKECFDENSKQITLKMPHCEGAGVDPSALAPINFKQSEEKSTKSLSSAREDQVQKFKQEFEAWQGSRSWEFSRKKGQNSTGSKEDPNKEITAGSTNPHLGYKSTLGTEGYSSVNMLRILRTPLHGFQHSRTFGKQLMPKTDKHFEPASRARMQDNMSATYSPTRIVILRSNSVVNEEDMEMVPDEKASGMEDFLEQVKERLRLEIEGKGRNDSINRLSMDRVSLHDQAHPSQEVARHVETLERSKSMRYPWKKISFWEDDKAVNESTPKHLRPFDDKVVPPGSPRSFPTSFPGSAFEKALIEDLLVGTEDQNEASKMDPAVKIRKKDSFSLKNTVSSLTRNLGLRSKFFGKKVSSMGEPIAETAPNVNPNETMPAVLRKFVIVQDNSTEVPPSPASFLCSAINEDHSPVSPLEVPFAEELSSQELWDKLSMTIQELANKTEHAESKTWGGIETKPHLYDTNETIIIEGCGEAYVKDILLLSGFDSACWSLDEELSSLDEQIKPIPSWVYDEMEEKFEKVHNVDHDYSEMLTLGNLNIGRRMLFDLANEAMQNVLSSHMTPLMPKRTACGLTELPQGNKLVDGVLNQIQMYANPKIEKIFWNLKLMPWTVASNEDISALGRDLERLILRDLIDDLVAGL